MRRTARAWWCLAALCGLGGALAGCGDPEPAVEGVSPAATASPLPTVAGEGGPKDLLARLRAHVAGGKGGPELNQDIAALRRLLWPTLESPEAQQASDAHVTLAHTAGAVGKTLALSPQVRAQVGEVDAISLEIHGAWLTAAAMPPDDYALWCSHQGAALLLRLRADRARLFDPARPSERAVPGRDLR